MALGSKVARNEVRVRLKTSGVNPSDTYRRRGPPAMEYPRVITNSDGAGVVDEVGPGVPARWLGERVWLYNGQRNGRWMGTAAEYIALDVDLVTELPAQVSFAEGATLGVPCMTAHRCVFLAGPVQGRVLLITGGAGAVGHYAVQLAKWAGATVIAIDREPAGEAAKGLDVDVYGRAIGLDLVPTRARLRGSDTIGLPPVAEVDSPADLVARLGAPASGICRSRRRAGRHRRGGSGCGRRRRRGGPASRCRRCP